jgi:hypothetical protein
MLTRKRQRGSAVLRFERFNCRNENCLVNESLLGSLEGEEILNVAQAASFFGTFGTIYRCWPDDRLAICSISA